MPRALLTGITGQDGSYLTELLLERGYEVHGVVRPTTVLEHSRLEHLYHNAEIYNRRLFLHRTSLDDYGAMRRIIADAQPDEFYHLAGQTHVGLSFELVESTCELSGMGTLRLLELLRDVKVPARFFHASSSEIFGQPAAAPQNEDTPVRPVTPYGCAKAFATNIVSVYRRTFNLFACNGILYNHESPRRGENFVTQKICLAAAAIKEGRQEDLVLGNTASQRDWGDARDYVQGMWLALQQPSPEDFVFATGELHSVQEVIETAFAAVHLDWRKHVKTDQKLFRPEDPVRLVGDPVKAEAKLHWKRSRSFKDLITEMTLAGLRKTKAAHQRPKASRTHHA
jgi:GDPmannose 4,6-dehydratase